MSHLFSSVGEFLKAFWYFVIMGGLFLELAWQGVVVLRAYDKGWDADKCERARPKRIDLDKALKRKVSLPWLGFPLLVIGAVLLYVFFKLFSNWDLQTYLLVATIWFATAPVRKIWGIAVARRVSQWQYPANEVPSFWDEVTSYYAFGFELPGDDLHEPWFDGKLKWLNKFAVFRYIFRIWRLWGILGQAIMSLAWPIAALIAPFYHMDHVDHRDYLVPWWRFNYKNKYRRPPNSGTVVDGSVGNNAGARDLHIKGSPAVRVR